MCISYLKTECEALKSFTKIDFLYGNNPLSIYEGFLSYGTKKSPYAKYYILDIDEQTENNDILECFQTFDDFFMLQAELLEKFFYSVSADIKYNIYLVIISMNTKTINARSKILADYNFGRKYIFNNEEAKRYFNMCHSLEKKNVEALSEYLPSILKYEAYWIEYMKNQTNLFDFIYFFEINEQRGLHNLFRRKKNSYCNRIAIRHKALIESIEDHKSKQEEFRRFFSSHRNYENHNIDVSCAQIEKVILKSYRNFGKNRELSFGKVNLFYGDNGAGKTSIIEAVEKIFTGQLSRERSFGEVSHNEGEALSAILRNKAGEQIELVNSNRTFCIQHWYGSNDCSSANRAFLRYNYFDIKGAFRFATTEKENKDYNLYDFLVDADLVKLNKTFDATLSEMKQLQNEINLRLSEINERKDSATKYKKKKKPQEHFMYDRNISKAFCSDWVLKHKTVPFNEDITSFIESILIDRKNECEESIEILEKLPKPPHSPDKQLKDVFDKIATIFSLLTTNRDYSNVYIGNENFSAKKNSSGIPANFSFFSAGQKICLALSTMLALFLSNESTPDFLIFDEPVSHLDPFYLLNLLDILRELSINGTQIFFTTSNPNTSNLFRRKFSFLGSDFCHFKLTDENNSTKITHCEYSSDPGELECEIEI